MRMTWLKRLKTAIQTLMNEEFIVHSDFIGEDFQALLTEVKTLTASEEGVRSILNQAGSRGQSLRREAHWQEKSG